MVTTSFVYPYRQGSKSATALAQGIEGRVIRLENSKFRPSAGKLIVNWGSTKMPAEYLTGVVKVLNPPELVRKASNKKMFFEAAKEAGEAGPTIPEFTFWNE